MKSISLKIQDAIFVEAEQLSDLLKTSRNRYINEALAFYNQHQKRKLLEAQLHQESELVMEDSMQVLAEFEALEDEYGTI